MRSTDPKAIEDWLFGVVRADGPRGEAARHSASELFAALGDPQDRVRAVHVVGTAGKGTVAHLVAHELRRAGVTVGLHVSPHVYDVRERFTVADGLPPWAEVAAAAEEVRGAIAPGREPTFFAVTAAMAYVLARRAGTDVLVVEAGIGGRHDATNTFQRADVLTVVTAIGLDHQDVLGSDVASIAAEKSAVLAGRAWAVLGPQPDPDARQVVQASARNHGTQLVEIPPAGDWQGDAAATAQAVLTQFLDDVPDLALPALPGRGETHDVGDRRWIFDGAHNPMKLEALVSTLDGETPPIIGVVAIGAGKDLSHSASVLARVLDSAVVLEFGFDDPAIGPRSHRADEVAGALQRAGITDVVVAADPAGAIEAVDRRRHPTVVVTGSFLHLGALRSALLGPGPMPLR